MKIRFNIILIAFVSITVLLLLTTGCRRTGPPNTVNRPEDVAGESIGALRGSASSQLARELGTVSTFDEIEDMLNHLRVGTINCIIIEKLVADEITSSLSGLRVLTEPLLEYDLRFAVAKENPHLLKAIDEAIDMLDFNSTLGSLRGKYFQGRSFTYRPPADMPSSSRYLTLAVSSDNAPFSFLDDNGVFTGFDVEVARAVTDFLGVELRIIPTAVPDLISDVLHGKKDMALGWLAEDVSEFVNVSEPYASSAHVVIVRRR